MKVEVIHAAGCSKCLRELGSLRAAASATDPTLDWKELDILQTLDYAVELGVLKPPAVAIDGELVFTSLPSPDALAAALRERLAVRN